MLPHRHAVISATVGAVAWAQSGDPLAFAAAVAAGIVPDVDHFADYVYFHRRGGHRLILPLHGYEYAALGGGMALISGNQVLAVAVLSYLIHLLADQLENKTRLFGYSLLFRAGHRFRVEAISTMPEAAMRGRDEDMRRLQKWFTP